MRVKVCGITNLEDALLAYELGAQALGFIFATSSPRYITPKACQNITLELPPYCERVGVFVDQDAKSIAQIVQACNLSAVQLHGSEDQSLIDELYELTPAKLIKAVREKDILAQNFEFKFDGSGLQAILIDGPRDELNKVVSGATFKKCRALFGLPLILAGALNSQNILQTIQEFKPEAIDLCSALESIPGKKDPAKLKEFLSKFFH
jgi:phosphoribosylanthranilate isomerase